MRLAGLFLLLIGAILAQETSPFLSIPPAYDELRFEWQRPPFEAKDIAGRTWWMEDSSRQADAHRHLVQLRGANAASNPPYWVVDREARLSAPVRAWSLGRVLYEIERLESR